MSFFWRNIQHSCLLVLLLLTKNRIRNELCNLYTSDSTDFFFLLFNSFRYLFTQFSSSTVLIILFITTKRLTLSWSVKVNGPKWVTEWDGDGTEMRKKACESGGRRVIADGKFRPSGISGNRAHDFPRDPRLRRLELPTVSISLNCNDSERWLKRSRGR